ncbi:MAG: bifunctional molybdenum cofactor guanylyltransferase MobA/molybdopterin-guanine dinucleotide biosynthesis adaptor protein MobB [Verrucomicrobia bacterium]|nr:bifunctional molybdenum cofactor guanylyltransferase MobA/molybdopterin-guanine dinucleotide biosynthesis adaptor protein MobB [Verrucomicrobiota bacterium]
MSMFHPFEVAVCGHSGTGKTTLITRLIARLGSTMRVGYAKHSSQAFSMDRAGKDTARATEAGATRVFISNDRATAMMTTAPVDFVQQRTVFDDCDCVLVEGWKSSPLPRLMVLDEAGDIVREPPAEKAGPVLAWVGAEENPGARPGGAVPYFCRDDVAVLAAFIMQHLAERLRATPVHGLVLAGGHSTRMQRDKAALEYGGRTQLERAYELVASRCAQTFVSARADQWSDGRFAAMPQIHDTIQNAGPTGGILSAMRAHPDAAWLVVACDLPYLDGDTLDTLMRGRAPFKIATAYTSANDGMPEPLCAIYEPRARSRFLQFMAVGYQCPRKMLINSNVHLLALGNRQALENINHPDEFAQAVRALAPDA